MVTLAAALALLGGAADAQPRRRHHRPDEPRPDAATLRRCGRPLPEPALTDRWARDAYARAEPGSEDPFWRFQWPPTSPCFREQEQERARLARAIRDFANARLVNTCWQNVLRLNPAVRDASVQITLAVDSRGGVTIAGLTGSPDPRFDQCLRAGLARVPSVGPGRRGESVFRVSLTTGG